MGEMLNTITRLAGELSDDSLRELEKVVDRLMRERGLKGHSTLRAALDAGEMVAAGKGKFKRKPSAYMRYVDGIDLAKLAEGKGFYAVDGAFLKDGEEPEEDRLLLIKQEDGSMDVRLWSDSYMAGERAKFGGKLAKVSEHPNADVLWRVARYFHPESKLTLER